MKVTTQEIRAVSNLLVIAALQQTSSCTLHVSLLKSGTGTGVRYQEWHQYRCRYRYHYRYDEAIYPHHVLRQCTNNATYLDIVSSQIRLQIFLFELISREEREGTEVEAASPGEKRIGRRTAPSRSSLSSAIGATGENIESSFECVRGRRPERL